MMVQTKIAFMPSVRPGLGFIEIVLTLAIITVASMIVAPNLFKRVPLYEQKEFVALLDSLVNQVWVQTLETEKVHKVIFNLASRTIAVERKTKEVDHNGKALFEPVSIGTFSKNYQWPENFKITQFFVEGVDEIGRHGDRAMQDVWFFIIPEGMAQEVIINLIDTKDTHYALDGQEISLVLNPFRIQFEMYEEFQNPATI